MEMKYLNKLFLGVLILLFAMAAAGCANFSSIFSNAVPTSSPDADSTVPASEFPYEDSNASPYCQNRPSDTNSLCTNPPDSIIVTSSPVLPTPEASPAQDLSSPSVYASFQTVWLMDGNEIEADMNCDGVNDLVSIAMLENSEPDISDYICRISMTMGDTGRVLFVDIYADAFCGALLHDFDMSDNSVELLVCYCINEDDYFITANALTPADNSVSVINSSMNGWIEHFSDGVIMVGSSLNLLGGWGATREFTVIHNNASELEFKPVSEEWLIYADGLPGIVTTREIAAQAYTVGLDSTSITLPIGSVLYPSATDMETYMEFVLEDGSECIIHMDIAPDGTVTIGSESADMYFDY